MYEICRHSGTRERFAFALALHTRAAVASWAAKFKAQSAQKEAGGRTQRQRIVRGRQKRAPMKQKAAAATTTGADSVRFGLFARLASVASL